MRPRPDDPLHNCSDEYLAALTRGDVQKFTDEQLAALDILAWRLEGVATLFGKHK